MQVRTFRGRSAKNVLDQVKTVMGDEAVILETRTVDENGTCSCEMTAAVDKEPDANGEGEGHRPGWGDWHREWDQIRGHLLTLMRHKVDLSRLSPAQRAAVQALEAEGVGEGVILHMWQRLLEDPTMSILTPLSEIVKFKPHGVGRWPQKKQMFTGPNGVGKTTTVLRTALAHRRERPDDKICLINADHTHGGGRLFLKHYAALSEMTYLDADGGEAMRVALRRSEEFDRVYIDLPCPGAEADLSAMLADFGLNNPDDAAVYLTLSPHYAPAQIDQFLRRFKDPSLGGLIWTKLDEACNYGSLVNTAFATGLPIASLCYGAGLKASMAAADAVSVWKLIFKHTLPGCNNGSN